MPAKQDGNSAKALMHLIQVTDSHLLADRNQAGYGNIRPFFSLQAILAEVAQLNPEVLLLTGDLSGDGSLQSYQHLHQLLDDAGLLTRSRMIPGNHDVPELMWRFFPQAMHWQEQPVYQSGWYIHGLDSFYKGTLGRVAQMQLDNLVRQIESQPDSHHLIAVHHHPLPVNGWMDRHQWLNRNDFLKTIQALPAVKLVLYGHIHSAISSRYGNIELLGCPSSCWQWQHTAEFGIADERPGYRQLQLNPDGTFESRVYRLQEQ